MICPSCRKPYLFIDHRDAATARCLRCGCVAPFVQPRYDNYHQELYTGKEYVRDCRTDPQMRRILSSLRIAPGEKVLDIGCGVGDYTREIAKRTPDVTGLDLCVDSARSRCPGLSFREYDCNQPLPFAPGTVDVIVSVNLVEHLEHYERFLAECARVLKSGGRIALTTANLDFFLHDWFFDRTHVHEWTLSQFGRLLAGTYATTVLEKSSGMFLWFPFNVLTTIFLKPDLLFVGTKR